MLIVKKCASAANQEEIFRTAKSCLEEYRKGNDMVLVLSAMSGQTEELIAKAKELNPNPSKREMDMLLSIGAQMAAAWMAMALEAMEIPAISLNAFQAKIHTTNEYGNAKITAIETERIEKELKERKIVIVTGVQGIAENMDITTLGRNGAEQTAVALAAALGADVCEIYPDAAAHGKEISVKRKWTISARNRTVGAVVGGCI